MTNHLVGISEIAAMLGTSRQRAYQLTRAEDFPAPEAELASGRVWQRAAVEQWARKHDRLPGERVERPRRSRQ